MDPVLTKDNRTNSSGSNQPNSNKSSKLGRFLTFSSFVAIYTALQIFSPATEGIFNTYNAKAATRGGSMPGYYQSEGPQQDTKTAKQEEIAPKPAKTENWQIMLWAMQAASVKAVEGIKNELTRLKQDFTIYGQDGSILYEGARNRTGNVKFASPHNISVLDDGQMEGIARTLAPLMEGTDEKRIYFGFRSMGILSSQDYYLSLFTEELARTLSEAFKVDYIALTSDVTLEAAERHGWLKAGEFKPVIDYGYSEPGLGRFLLGIRRAASETPPIIPVQTTTTPSDRDAEYLKGAAQATVLLYREKIESWQTTFMTSVIGNSLGEVKISDKQKDKLIELLVPVTVKLGRSFDEKDKQVVYFGLMDEKDPDFEYTKEWVNVFVDQLKRSTGLDVKPVFQTYSPAVHGKTDLPIKKISGSGGGAMIIFGVELQANNRP